MTPIASLLADTATHNWLSMEMLLTIGGVISGVAGVFGFIRWSTAMYRRRAKRLQSENEDLTDQLAKNEEKHQLALAELQVKCDAFQAELEEHKSDVATHRRRIHRALSKDGQTWTERVLHNAPGFKVLDLEERPTPIISVLNLKGGVGKTTITANLAAALDNRGYRVLLIDLDLQGSLTGLFLTDNEQEQLAGEGKLLGNFLEASFEADHPNLLDYTRQILGENKSGIVPTNDGLVYAETNLTIRWLLREEGNRDPRFLLRKELHLKRITNNYDLVLLDCPPVINICCVNALAASDYLLVPILPSKQATSRVPVLLKRLKEFRENITERCAANLSVLEG
ncbi:MAG: AAA family ATPase [Gemmataceae bacterium]